MEPRPEEQCDLTTRGKDGAEIDPVMCESYLSSPLETILESLSDYDWEYISCHDIIEAYSVLSARIRSVAHVVMSTKQTLPALLPFKEHGASLARALKRDIQRALLNTGLRQPPSFYDSYSSNTPMTDHDLQHIVDLSNLSHHSLRVLSDIFALRALHVLIPVQDLNDLLKEILKIASMIELPTPNSEKTVSLVFWLLQIQRLPSAILEPRKDEIVKALRDALNGQRGLQAKRDSLKAINSLLKHQPVLFTTPLHGFIFTILANLTSEDTDCRLQACNALSGLVLAKFDRPDFPHQGISQEVHSFLKPQIPPRNHQPSFSQEDYPLHYFVAQALAPESNDTQEPIWAVITLASLITLADRWLYTYKDLAFCADRLQPAFVHKRREVRQLARAAWGCLVWAFTLLPAHPTWLHPEDPSIADVSLSVRGKAFRFLKSDVTGGKGVLLARGLLLSPARGNDRASADAANVSRALLVLKTMIIGGKPSDSDVGIRMLCGVLSMRGTKTDDVKPNLGLFEGTIIDGAPRKARDTVKWVSEMNLERIRALAEAEIIHHWETLVDVWIDAVERTLQMSLPLSNGLLDVWQSLLLARADLTHARLTGSSRFAIQIAGIVTGFLVQSLEPPIQVLRLVSVKRLWGVMKNVFAVTWLPAEMVLASVLKVNFSLNDMEVKGAWSELCADLILVGVPTLLHVISTGSEGKDVTRHLWTVLAKTWQVPDGKAHWEELVSFLVIPFKSWVMSGVETELWKAVLHSSVSMAEANSVTPNAVVDRFFLRLEEEVNALVAFPQGVAALIVYVDLSECTLLPQTVTAVIDRTLQSNYPPQPESLAAILEIIRQLERMISAVPRILLVKLLSAVEKGMCCWIADEKVAMLTREHDVVVQQLYCSTLQLLRDVPHSLESLTAISPFLSSAFGRLSSSATGPLAFNAFWRATYHGVEEYRSLYPDCLKACLLGFSDAYGGSIAEGLSMSQGICSSSIPDSQPFYPDREEAWFSGVGDETKQLSHIQSLTPRRGLSPEPPVKRRRIDGTPARKDLETSPPFLPDEFEVECVAPSRPSEPLRSAPRPTVPSQEVSRESPFGLSMLHLTPQVPASSNKVVSHKRSSEPPEFPRSKRRKMDYSQEILPTTVLVPGSPPHMPTSPEVPFAFPSAASIAEDHSNSQPRHPDVFLSPEVTFYVPPPAESLSQDTDTRKRKRIIEWVNVSKNLMSSAPRGSTSRVGSSGPNTPIHARTRASTPASEEYDTWEAGAASMQEIMQLQQELSGSDGLVPETDFEGLNEETEPSNSDLDDFRGSSQLAMGSKLEYGQEHQCWSHTVPQRPTSAPLTRTHTSSSVRFDALERAYTAVANAESQTPVEDLVHASGLVNRIQSALTEQLTRRLAKSEPGDGR